MKQTNQILMQASDELFWQELNSLDGKNEDRYLVVDKKKKEIIAENAVLIKDKKIVEV